ncbi:MAG TPA: response regulator [Steroidobacteraceae bacterium]
MPSDPPTSLPLESGRPLPAGEIKILLVDDQPARLLSYETILEGLGYGMVRATSGLQALEQLMKDEFAVILLDVSMPGMDGFETASLIHEHPRFERTPIIFVTGVNVSELDQLKGYKLGAVDYVHVPVVPEILRSKISVLVELYCKRRELQSVNEELATANAELEKKNEELAAANRALELDKARELEVLNLNLKTANVELEEAIRALQAEVDVRAAVEEQLKVADRHKDEFLAMLAHELRNPLAPIRNAVHILRARMSADAEVRWVQDVIDRQVGSLTRLVDDLLDVSRITRGKINISREAVALGAILSSAVETVQPLLSEKQHRLSLDVPEPELLLDGDLTRLTQVIGNILSNAVKYTDSGGEIALSGRRVGDYVEIRVRDDGTGIAAADLARIFDLFTQGEQNNQSVLGGLGIGLALVRRLVELHGGTVVAQSEGLGRGSEFIVRLPRRLGEPYLAPVRAPAPAAAHAPTLERASCEPPLDSAHRTGRRLLIVDDNLDALDSLAALMEMSGHEVHMATDGESALVVAESCRPEVVLLDLGLPKLDGYEVARRLRESPWGRAAMIIALTGWGQDEDRRRTRESGFDSHMVKPLDLDALLRLLGSSEVTHS